MLGRFVLVALCLGIVFLAACGGRDGEAVSPNAKDMRLMGKRTAAHGGRYGGSSPTILPGGKYIVFGSPEPGTLGNIYKVELESGKSHAISPSPFYEGEPSVDVSGKHLAFISERDGVSKVYLFDLNSNKTTAVTSGDFIEYAPLLGATGTIFFSRRLSGNPDAMWRDEIFSIKTDGSDEKQLTKNNQVDCPVSVSADGAKLYYASGLERFDLMRMDLANEKSELILPLQLRGCACDVSPDEQWVAYCSDQEKPFEYEVYVSRLDGSERRKLTELGGYIGGVRFTPDGKNVTFVAEPKGEATGAGDIWMVSVDGANRRKIMTIPQSRGGAKEKDKESE